MFNVNCRREQGAILSYPFYVCLLYLLRVAWLRCFCLCFPSHRGRGLCESGRATLDVVLDGQRRLSVPGTTYLSHGSERIFDDIAESLLDPGVLLGGDVHCRWVSFGSGKPDEYVRHQRGIAWLHVW